MTERPKTIPYGRQDINDDDVAAVIQVLRSDWLTQGPAIEFFERQVAEYCGAKYAVAVSNATAALHIACMAAGIGEGDQVWTSPNTFVASANCALYCRAAVDFVDIDAKTYNMDPTELARKLTIAASKGKLPKAIIPVHFAGQSADMEKIRALANRHGIRVIEDASHAVGGRYRSKPIGSCQYSDMTVLSFHPVKIITTGEGGMVLTNDETLHAHLVRLRSHGITRDPALMTHSPDGPWYYQQIELGYNYRLTDLQAALGTSQMKRLDMFCDRRRELAHRYDEALVDLPVTIPWQSPEGRSAYHLYPIRIRLERVSRTHREVFEELRSEGIAVNLHYIPVHLQPYYARMGFKPGDFPEAEKYYREAISLPMYYGLSDSDQSRVVAALRIALRVPT